MNSPVPRQSPMVDKRGIPVVLSAIKPSQPPRRKPHQEDGTLDAVKLCAARPDKSLMEMYDVFSDACHQSHLNHIARSVLRSSPKSGLSSSSAWQEASTELAPATPSVSKIDMLPLSDSTKRGTQDMNDRHGKKQRLYHVHTDPTALRSADTNAGIPSPGTRHATELPKTSPPTPLQLHSHRPFPRKSASQKTSPTTKDPLTLADPSTRPPTVPAPAPSPSVSSQSTIAAATVTDTATATATTTITTTTTTTEENAAPLVITNGAPTEAKPSNSQPESDKPAKGPSKGSHLSKEVTEEIEQVNNTIQNLCNYYKLVDLIGKGTFSSVYKAVDLRHDYYDNSTWKDPQRGSQSHHVALKRIRATSSPDRIAREISILCDLQSSPCVVPLITAFRQADEVYIVLPYLEHDNFARIYRIMTMMDMRYYLRSLFTGLMHLHELKIMHRDIKPNNFLYSLRRKSGSVIDFGLAERENSGGSLQANHPSQAPSLAGRKPGLRLSDTLGYYRNDSRKQVRANRAGTKGFRAPEVLLRVTHQTTAIDIWSVGVIFLSLLTHRFPFFLSFNEADALVELCCLFGADNMKAVAVKYNRSLNTNIPTLPSQPISWSELIDSFNKDTVTTWDASDVTLAIDLLDKCMTLDASLRITAKEALDHPFLSLS